MYMWNGEIISNSNVLMEMIPTMLLSLGIFQVVSGKSLR